MENVLWLAGRGYFAIQISAIKSFSYRVILSSFFSLKQRTSLDLLTLAFDEPKLSLTTLKNLFMNIPFDATQFFYNIIKTIEDSHQNSALI